MRFEQGIIQDFIGKGITFPIVLVGGKPPIETGYPLLRKSIRTILGWPVGSRYYLAEFGSRLEELIEEPNDEILKNLINTFVIDAIDTWEQRVEVLNVSMDDITDTKVGITLVYRIINSKKEDSFVFPFYRQIKY